MVGVLNGLIGRTPGRAWVVRVQVPFQQREGLHLNLNAQGKVMTARKDGR